MSVSDMVNKDSGSASSTDVIAASASSDVEKPKKKVNYNIDEIFTDIKDVEKDKGLRVLLWGASGVGKTHAALSFPGPIYVIDTDGGIVQNYKYYKDKDIKVVECYDTMPDEVSEDDSIDPFNIDPIYSLEKFDTVTQALAMKKVSGTIIVDTISDIWKWIGTWLDRYSEKSVSAKSGKEYLNRFAWGNANNKYDWIMKRFKETNANIVLIAREKSEYDKEGDMTGNVKFEAQKHSDYHVDYDVHLVKNLIDGKWVREAYIGKSRGADIVEPKIQNFNYDSLMKLLEKYGGDISQ